MFRPTPQWKVQQSKPSTRARSQFKPTRFAATTAIMDEERDHDNFDEVADIARKSYKLAKELAGELNVEYKVMQGITLTLLPDDAGATSGSSTVVNSCAQGVTDTSRTGDSIKISNFWIAGQVLLNTASPAANDIHFVRCIVFWQKANDIKTNVFPSSTAAIDGLLDFLYKGTSVANLAPKDYDSDASSEILWDKTFQIDNTQFGHHFKKLIRINRHTQFENDSTGINTGVLRVVWLSNDPSSNASRADVQWVYRTYFVDN